jgi:hypothetical protein
MSYLAQFFLEWELFGTKRAKKIRTHILCSIIFRFRKSCRLWDNVEEYCRAGHVTNDNIAHAQSMLDSRGYKPTTPIARPLQLRLHERASMLCSAYTVLLMRILFWYVCACGSGLSCQFSWSSALPPYICFWRQHYSPLPHHPKTPKTGPKLTKCLRI